MASSCICRCEFIRTHIKLSANEFAPTNQSAILSRMKGFQVIADFYHCACDDALLQDAARLASTCLEACAHAGLTVVAQAFHQFGDGHHLCGATGAVVLAESHLAVHTWPELRAVTLDIYICNVSQDNRERVQALYNSLYVAFQPRQVQKQTLQRGNLNQPFGSASGS